MINKIIFNLIKRNPKNMTNDEICSIVISLCHLNLEFFNLLDDCLSQLRKNFDELNALNLVQLLVAGKYYINYSKHSGN
jgi:hypothetical protein